LDSILTGKPDPNWAKLYYERKSNPPKGSIDWFEKRVGPYIEPHLKPYFRQQDGQPRTGTKRSNSSATEPLPVRTLLSSPRPRPSARDLESMAKKAKSKRSAKTTVVTTVKPGKGNKRKRRGATSKTTKTVTIRPPKSLSGRPHQRPHSKGPHITTIHNRSERISVIQGINPDTYYCAYQNAINPGLATIFPWLSQIAGAYEMYRFKNLRFEFKSTSSVFNGATPELGRITMVTEYDELKGPFGSMTEAENYDGSTMFMPYQNATHSVDVRGKRMGSVLDYKARYVRTGDLSTAHAFGGSADPHAYDVGLFHLCIEGTPNSKLGELWVHYSIDLIKPRVDLAQGLVYGNTVETTALTDDTHHNYWDVNEMESSTSAVFPNANNNMAWTSTFDAVAGVTTFRCANCPGSMIFHLMLTATIVSEGAGIASLISIGGYVNCEPVTDNKLQNDHSMQSTSGGQIKKVVLYRRMHTLPSAGPVSFTINNPLVDVNGCELSSTIMIESCEWLDPLTAYPESLEEKVDKLATRLKRLQFVNKKSGVPRQNSLSDFEEVKISEGKQGS